MVNDSMQDDKNDGDLVSKSEMKRRMIALQELGEALTQLKPKQLASMPVADEQLLEAIKEVQHIRSNSARRRHLQFIGKLMRNIDPAPIQAALEDLHQERNQHLAGLHEVEALRDKLLAQGPKGIEPILAQWPHAERQHLRQLVLQHQREQAQGKAPAASRKLFRYLRELQENKPN